LLTVNLGTGRRTTVEQLLTELTGVLPGLRWTTTAGTAGDQFGIYADTRRLIQTFGAHPMRPLGEGLRAFVDWARPVVVCRPARDPAPAGP
jgi:nucleoside-diphosphate-sugar epimerase